MLLTMHIKNIALIEEIDIDFHEQLNILTENNAQCQAAVTEFQNKMRKSATEFTDSMKTVVSDTEKRVGMDWSSLYFRLTSQQLWKRLRSWR